MPRCEYTAIGPNAFAVMRSVAYGLHEATVEEITYCGDSVPWPYDEALPTGTGRDEKLHAMANRLHGEVGAPRHEWAGQGSEIRGQFTFDGTDRQRDWLVNFARPHAASFHTELVIPTLDGETA